MLSRKTLAFLLTLVRESVKMQVLLPTLAWVGVRTSVHLQTLDPVVAMQLLRSSPALLTPVTVVVKM
jgi:hypothetical protein